MVVCAGVWGDLEVADVLADVEGEDEEEGDCGECGGGEERPAGDGGGAAECAAFAEEPPEEGGVEECAGADDDWESDVWEAAVSSEHGDDEVEEQERGEPEAGGEGDHGGDERGESGFDEFDVEGDLLVALGAAVGGEATERVVATGAGFVGVAEVVAEEGDVVLGVGEVRGWLRRRCDGHFSLFGWS